MVLNLQLFMKKAKSYLKLTKFPRIIHIYVFTNFTTQAGYDKVNF